MSARELLALFGREPSPSAFSAEIAAKLDLLAADRLESYALAMYAALRRESRR